MDCSASFGGGDSMWVQALGQSLETLQSLEILKLVVSQNYGVGESAGQLVGDFMPDLKNLKDMSLYMMGVHMNDSTLQHVGNSIGASCSNLQARHPWALHRAGICICKKIN